LLAMTSVQTTRVAWIAGKPRSYGHGAELLSTRMPVAAAERSEAALEDAVLAKPEHAVRQEQQQGLSQFFSAPTPATRAAIPPNSGSSFCHAQLPPSRPAQDPRRAWPRAGKRPSDTSLSPALKSPCQGPRTPEKVFENQALSPEVFSFICHLKLRTSYPWPHPAQRSQSRAEDLSAMASCKNH